MAAAKGDLERDLNHVVRLGLIERDQAGGRQENRAVLGKKVAQLRRDRLFHPRHNSQFPPPACVVQHIEGGTGRIG